MNVYVDAEPGDIVNGNAKKCYCGKWLQVWCTHCPYCKKKLPDETIMLSLDFQIYDLLAGRLGEWIPAKEIAAKVATSVGTCRYNLNKMVEQGKVQKAAVKKHTNKEARHRFSVQEIDVEYARTISMVKDVMAYETAIDFKPRELRSAFMNFIDGIEDDEKPVDAIPDREALGHHPECHGDGCHPECFLCCGGSDEDPQRHCADCPDHGWIPGADEGSGWSLNTGGEKVEKEWAGLAKRAAAPSKTPWSF